MPLPLVLVSGYAPTVSCFALDAAAGTLTPLGSSPGGEKPSFLAWSPDRRSVYAVNELEAGRVLSFRLGGDGALTQTASVASGGGIPAHLSVHPSGRWVYVAHYRTGHVAVVPVLADGAVGEPVQVLLAGIKAHMAKVDPGGRRLIVPCLGSDYLAVYAIDQAAGTLTLERTVPMPAGHGPRHIDFHPRLPMAYVINELGNTLTSLAWDAAAGTFSDPVTIPTLPPGFTTKSTTAHVVASGDGRFLYGSNRGHDSLVVYRLDAAGRPEFVAHETGGGELRVPRNFSIDATGTILLAASQGAAAVTIFRRDPASGLLTRLGAVAVADKPSFVGIMPRP